jgi:hypothetical protein
MTVDIQAAGDRLIHFSLPRQIFQDRTGLFKFFPETGPIALTQQLLGPLEMGQRQINRSG